MTSFLEFIDSQILLLDGAMGTQIQGADLKVEEDYWGQENCSEILNLSRPDFIRGVHMKYLAAGSDAVETNTFGGSSLTLAEFGLEDKTIEINRRACELAHEAEHPRVSREELLARCSPHFELLEEWVPRSYPNRTGLELMTWWQRRA